MELSELEGAITDALRAIASTVPDVPSRSFSEENVRKQIDDGHSRRGSQRGFRLRSVAVAGVVVVLLAGVVVAVRALSTSTPTHRSAGHAIRPTTTTTVTPGASGFEVMGYTTAQATSTAQRCLAASYAHDLQGAYLRATFTDGSGTTVVVTTPAGWYTCNESADGVVLTAGLFESFAEVQGWGLSLPPGNPTPSGPKADESAKWLTAPVELASEGGGYYSKSTLSEGWLDTAVGRVAPDIAKVTIQMPGGSIVTAAVENGFFVARQLLPAMPPFNQSGVIPIMGYDHSGALVYDSQTSSTAFQCYVTPTGQPVTPQTQGQKCRTAIRW